MHPIGPFTFQCDYVSMKQAGTGSECLAESNDFANKEIPGYGDKRFTGQVGVSVAETIH